MASETSRTPNFNHLYYFYVTAREGSISRARAVLGVSQPTISEQIKQLEQYLDARLFDRRPDGLALTDAGRLAYQHAEVMFEAGQRLLEVFQGSHRRHERALLEVGVASSVSRTHAVEFLMPLLRSKDIRVRIRHGDYPYMLQALLSHEIELLLSDSQPAEFQSKGIEADELNAPRLLLVAAPDLAQRLSQIPEDLRDQPFVHYALGSPFRVEVDRYLRTHGLSVDVVAEVDHVGLMKSAILEARCVGALPENQIEEELASGKLQIVTPLEDVRVPVYAVYHHVEAGDRVRQAIETLRKRAAEARQKEEAQIVEERGVHEMQARGDQSLEQPQARPPGSTAEPIPSQYGRDMRDQQRTEAPRENGGQRSPEAQHRSS